MKKIIILIPFLMLASLPSMGQNIKRVSLDFSMDNFQVQRDNVGNVFLLSNVYDYFFKQDTLQPALPYIGFNVLVRSNEQYDSHVCSGPKSLFRNNVTMAQNPEAIPTNTRPYTNGIKSDVSYSQGIYPNEFVEFAGMNECDGYRILTFHVCPFEYDVTAQKLYLRTHVDLDIHLKPSPSALPTRTGNREAVRNVIRRMVVNPEDLDDQNLSISNRSNNILKKQTGFEYVIVTSNQFKSTFQELANWKSKKGIRSKVLTVEDIISTYNGFTNQERIKNALADIDSLSYVLLGGDNLNVPTCMCYIGYYANADSITPADVYYSCLHTKNWDKNGNGFYGELTDSVCMIPILNVSRAPVSTVEDAQVFVSKIINYESAPDTTNWKNDILMCGTSLGHKTGNVWHPYYINGQSDTQLWSQMIYDQYIDSLWEGNQLTRFYDTYTDISQDATYDFNKNNLQNELGEGYTFVDEYSHGWANKWGWLEDETLYKLDKASSLVNSGYSIITTIACYTNAFDKISTDFPNETEYYTTCLSESFMRNPDSGILAYFGSSREGWPNQTYLFIEKFYENLLSGNDKQFGKAAMESKNYYVDFISTSIYNNYRWLIMTLNPLGDPEMPIYTQTPQTFNNVSVSFSNGSLNVSTGINDCTICISSAADFGESYYMLYNNVNGVSLNDINADSYLCITKQSYIPYIARVGNSVFLQNEDIVRNLSIFSSNTYVGSNVNSSITQGPVTIHKGKVINKSAGSITIQNDFEVKSGAELEILQP